MNASTIDILFVAAKRETEMEYLLRKTAKSFNSITLRGETESGHTFRVVYADVPDFTLSLSGLRFREIRIDPLANLSERQKNTLILMSRK